MFKLTHSFVKYRKGLFTLLSVLGMLIGLSSGYAWSSNGLPRIDSRTLGRLEKQHPVIVLFRHAQRCDRSDNTCLSDKTGITEYGARQARMLGQSFGQEVKDYDLYASDTVRTIQSATWFSTGQKVIVNKDMHQCGRQTASAIKRIASMSADKNVVIFTHNHCLTYLAKNMRGVKITPDYLDGLVMHVQNGKLFLDGKYVAS
ncbi:lipopolysaccharide core heptose(II)-phosphate phosphatase [Citrobacter amalonaticus]|uniref:lipopolysaccharide core heptose(II)-phosphate phosphatase n=1 Tax=Citrobacter amalonaticus TaxID=35703 RepID=UPI00300D3141